jgi:hypothetical protein
MTDKLTIRTNRKPRDILSWHELSDKERKEFDYLDTEDKQADAQFARYRNWVYDLGEFMRAPDSLKPWDGCASDSYFSGTLVRFVDDNERVVMATYFS